MEENIKDTNKNVTDNKEEPSVGIIALKDEMIDKLKQTVIAKDTEITVLQNKNTDLEIKLNKANATIDTQINVKSDAKSGDSNEYYLSEDEAIREMHKLRNRKVG